jgi:translation initiation factor 2B subunit (eIF-2B alpha/beta/delta family)
VSWTDVVEEIRKDRARGASALAERALDALSESKKAGPALLKARPGMPFVEAVVRRALKAGVPATRRALASARAKLLQRADEILPPGGRYVVYGRSGTVDAVVAAVKGRAVEEIRADVALIGADALLPNGDFVNAKGTADFVRRAREARCGVFAVAIELKRVAKAPPLEKGFELVPGKLVHAVLTETGLHYPPLAAVPGVDPTWLDRGALSPDGGTGRCHPHHGPR